MEEKKRKNPTGFLAFRETNVNFSLLILSLGFIY